VKLLLLLCLSSESSAHSSARSDERESRDIDPDPNTVGEDINNKRTRDLIKLVNPASITAFTKYNWVNCAVDVAETRTIDDLHILTTKELQKDHQKVYRLLQKDKFSFHLLIELFIGHS